MLDSQIKLLKALRWGALIVLVTGLLPSLAIWPATEEPWRFFFDILTWPLDSQPASFATSERQLSAVLGGVLCGWAYMMYRLADPKIFNQQIRRLMLSSVWIWFLLDSLGSIISDIPLNAVSNLFFLAILVLPLMALKKFEE
jgi:hypothetical protein